MTDNENVRAYMARSTVLADKLQAAFKELEVFLEEGFELATKIERERIADLADKAGLHKFAASLREEQGLASASPPPAPDPFVGVTPVYGCPPSDAAVTPLVEAERRCAACGYTATNHVGMHPCPEFKPEPFR
jgi:hypothetical protein